MNAPDRNADRAALVPIGDWWPGGWKLSAIIRRSRVAEQPAAALGLVQGVSTYGDWPFRDAKLAREFGDYVYGSAGNLEAGSEAMNFLWYPPQPAVADGQFQQQLVQEFPTSEDYSWPPVLLDLAIIMDKSNVRQTGFELDLRAAVDRGLWRDGVTVPCLMMKREWVSYTRPPPWLVRVEVPMPTPIRGDYYGQPIRLPACLHPRIELMSINSSDAVIYDATPDREQDASGNLMVFGATNFQTWDTHVCANHVTLENGIYRRTEVTVNPPPMPAITYA